MGLLSLRQLVRHIGPRCWAWSLQVGARPSPRFRCAIPCPASVRTICHNLSVSPHVGVSLARARPPGRRSDASLGLRGRSGPGLHYPYIHTFIRSYSHSFLHSFIHSLIHLFIYLFTYLFIYMLGARKWSPARDDFSVVCARGPVVTWRLDIN